MSTSASSRSSFEISNEISNQNMDYDITKYIIQAISCRTYDIALLVHFMYKNKYQVARLKSKIWYMFDGVKWKLTELGPYYELSTNVVNVFQKFIDSETLKLDDGAAETTPRSTKLIEERINGAEAVITKLKNVNSKELICKECLYMFYNPDFLANLDTNMSLICFQNGVLNLTTCCFREAMADDMLSIHIECEYLHPSTTKENADLVYMVEMFQKFRKKIIQQRKTKYSSFPV